MQLKFKNKDRITEEGFFLTLLDALNNDDKTATKLTTSELLQIPTFFASVDPEFNVTEWDRDVTSANGKTLSAPDFKALVAMMYMYPRGKYWQPKSSEKAYTTTEVCGAVPFPMLGFKRFQDIPYSYFMPNYEYSVEEMFRLDCLLGNAFASTFINKQGEVDFCVKKGLGRLSATRSSWPEMRVGTIRRLREEGFGNRRGNALAGFGASIVKDDTGDEFVELYNESNVFIKHLLTQRWIFYYLHRNDDMICDVRDWDNLPKSIDTSTASLKDLEPKANKNELFGL